MPFSVLLIVVAIKRTKNDFSLPNFATDNDKARLGYCQNVYHSNHLMPMKQKIFSIEELMQTPLCMMTGEQFAFLVSNLTLISDQTNKNKTEAEKPKHLVYGIKGIADTFGCSIPTANRIKRSGIIDGAITQVGRKIVIDADLALELAAKAKKEGKEVCA